MDPKHFLTYFYLKLFSVAQPHLKTHSNDFPRYFGSKLHAGYLLALKELKGVFLILDQPHFPFYFCIFELV